MTRSAFWGAVPTALALGAAIEATAEGRIEALKARRATGTRAITLLEAREGLIMPLLLA